MACRRAATAPCRLCASSMGVTLLGLAAAPPFASVSCELRCNGEMSPVTGAATGCAPTAEENGGGVSLGCAIVKLAGYPRHSVELYGCASLLELQRSATLGQ